MDICLYRYAHNREIPNPRGKLAEILQEATANLPAFEWRAICAGIQTLVDGYELRLQPSSGSSVCVKLPWRYTNRKFKDAETAVTWVYTQMLRMPRMKRKSRQAEVEKLQEWFVRRCQAHPVPALSTYAVRLDVENADV